jgi:hypothetical protein
MSEEKVEMPAEEPAVEPAESRTSKGNIGNELQQLGRNLTAATKAVLESPEAHEVGGQLQKGLESLEKTVHQLAKQARETPVGQKVESGVSEAATTVKERGFLETLAESFAGALHTVNKTLEQAVDKAQTRAQQAAAKESEPQHIEVVGPEEEPETGEE